MAELDATSRVTIELSQDDGGAPIVSVSGEVDLSSVERLRTTVEPVLSSSPDRIIFDLAGLDFMDSSGLAFLLAVAQRVGEVDIRNAGHTIRRVIELTGLDAILRITE